MRKIKGSRPEWTQTLKVPAGVCAMCGGKGRFRTVYKYKNPIIRVCLRCSGTGEVKVRIKPIDEENVGTDWREGEFFRVVSENENHYILGTTGKGLTLVRKDEFTIY